MNCEVCNDESGGTFAGVACIPGVPLSISWCSECLKKDSAPKFVFEHDFIFVAGGRLTELAPWARQRVTWSDGKYISFDEYVQRISPQEVEKQLREFEAAR